MNYSEFYALFELEPIRNILILLALILLYYYIFKNPSLFSPIMLGTIAHAAACFCVVLMYIENVIDIKFFYLFIATEFSYLFGYRLSTFFIPQFKNKTYIRDPKPIFILYYYIHFTLLFIVQIIVLYSVGIVALKNISRLTSFKDIGYLSWLYDGLLLSAPYVLFLKRYKIKKSYSDFIVMLFIFSAFLLKGARSDALYILWGGYFVYKGYKLVNFKKILFKISLIVLIVVFFATAISLKMHDSDTSIVKTLWTRTLAFGDVFFMGLNEPFLNKLGHIDAMSYLFSPIYSVFAKLGIISPPDKTKIGFELYEYHYKVFAEIGPNARHNILGYILFGFYGAIVFSLICGVILGVSSSLFNLGSTELKKYFFSIISMFSVFIMIDPTLFVGYTLKFSFVFSICYVLYLIFTSQARLENKNNNNNNNNNNIVNK
jgi:hypothetical protein